MSSDEKEAHHAAVVQLAQLFSSCVECFGLIHPSKDYDRAQLILLAQLGIQQARLLAWGDNVGITSTGSLRDPRIDEPDNRLKIEKALQNIVDRPVHVHRTTMMEKYGLKSPKRSMSLYQPALDTARLEVFRTKFEALNNERWEVRRGMSVTAHHWQIVDSEKFKTFLQLVKENVTEIINLMSNEASVDRGVKSDIRALGWHPIFDRVRAATDTSKLRLIRDACKDDYPDYSKATESALAYIEREWKDNYEEVLQKGRDGAEGSEIPGAAARLAIQAAYKRDLANAGGTPPQSPKKDRRPSIFGFLRPKSRRTQSEDTTPRSKSADETAMRSQSVSSNQPTPHEDHANLEATRSKSISVIPYRTTTSDHQPDTIPEDDPLARVPTAESVGGQESSTVGPITSMISRHDQFKSLW